MPYESLPVVRSVRRVLATAASPDEAITRVLEAVGDSMGWLVGAFWVVERDMLRARCVWAARIHKGSVFATETEKLRLGRGEGLPGEVWFSGDTVWVEDVGKDPEFVRAGAAREDGLHAAVAFPVRHGKEVLGVLEFFTDMLRAPVQTLLPVFDQIGAEVGTFVAAAVAPLPPADDVEGAGAEDEGEGAES
jgi:signal transduction protein with GAF and PtsI domain